MSKKSDGKGADFVFLPLGGVGEIGMNLYLYGYGRDGAREWLIVDMGITFGGETEPGIDVILPDIRFIEEEKHNIVGLLLTHAHEDHFGAVVDLWPQLAGIPVYATPFTAEMLKSKLAEMGLVNGFPLEIVPLGHRRTRSIRAGRDGGEEHHSSAHSDSNARAGSRIPATMKIVGIGVGIG